jgi:PKD repeat protein
MSVIAVIYIIWAGAQMLLNPSSEESSEKTKKIIISVIAGIVIIWFAWWIVSTIFYILNNRYVAMEGWIPRAVAETQVRAVDFTTYSNQIRAQKSRISAGYSPEVTSELNVLIDGAYDHLPDRADKYVNRQLYDKVKKALSEYDLHREEIDRGILENAIDAFLEQAEIFSIQGALAATPREGDAPLSVTLEGKNIIDSSGTIIPEQNFTWWLRTPNGPQILGRGKTINHVFQDEGTYTVYLTVNSASKNSRWFTDVMSFEDQVSVEIGQPKLKLIVYFNDQLATDNVKIPTRESSQKILIDATQTKFASGYTITKTEWDFGNGRTIIREWAPIVEAQDYKEGEYTVKVTLTRNDGEVFTRSILLKIGDPIASISVNNKNPNKGETIVFQAKKVTQEGVNYSWEIRKIGSEQTIYTVTGPRMEYVFREAGRYNIGLISSKGDVRDKETVEINIESRAPIVRFNADQIWPETPNIYILDGTSTYDPDYPDDQSLKYQWYINDKPVQLSDTNSNNSRGEYTFPELGVYQVELHVSDDQGKMSIFKKTITIKSLLSVQINIRPQVVKRGEKVMAVATAPNVDIYEWSIGSKNSSVTQVGRYITSFEAAGTYPLSLKVTDKDGNTNTIQRKIYVVDGDKPFSVMQMSTKSLFTEVQPNACNGMEALIADRVTPVSLVGEKSVNVGGKPIDLTYFWKIGLNTSSTQKNFSHTFDELGCEEISLTVTDKKTGASHTSKEWIKVVNIPPKFSDIQVVVENIDQDPMRINLKMEGAKDPDGVIRSYTWYYYTNTDEQPQGFRITTKPETSFSLPKINGRYNFSVVMEDANGLRVDTRDISENKFSTPDLLVNQNISTPLIEFRANTTDAKYGDAVELTTTVKNALGQDITKVSEYRWDVDGDGFYDIKTSENVLSYKFTIPGEYHPKVKVTHRWLSTTKFLTVNVTNRLIPQAQVQIIGDKIIAYNTSTGIFQSVSWFADETKVSENKEYLLFTPNAGNFPKNIRLEIGDGQDKQSVTIPVQRDPQNKILLRKIWRPLILLTNENTSVTAAPDEIVWSDPIKPLFFYLGESEGAIQYYIIDNDVDIDTDLSGGKSDDADNKGTASYRVGRPYQVPLGNKRVTIMKFRILDADGSEIDSRQVRVTRSFMAEVNDTDIIGVTPNKDTQEFNLSKEDKARLDRLSTLVKSIPDEVVRKDILRFVDQLGDIWYDRSDRAETLLQFSRAVDGSQITADLKTRILEQVNLIYTQGQQDTEEKVLARIILTDFLAKSSYKKEIFGDGTTENTGLLGEIIDNPEYYEQNKKLIERIYNEYVKFDTALSDDAKTIIQEKLNFLIGSPPVKSTIPDKEVIIDENGKTGFFTNFFKKDGLGSILLWIGLAIVGLFGVIFAWSKIASSRHTHRDTSHANPHNQWTSETHDAHETHDAPSDMHHDDTNTPDWLKSAESPFGSDDVLSKEIAHEEDHKTHTPEWMHDHEEKHEEKHTLPEKTSEPVPASHSEETPDWLKDTPEHIPDVAAKTTVVPSTPVVEEKPLIQNPIEAPKSDTHQNDIPDWLKWAETPAVEKEAIAEDKITSSDLFTPENLQESNATLSTSPEKEVPTETPIPTANTEDDIPDWLKGADTPIADTQKEIVEESTEATTWNVVTKEDTIESPTVTEESTTMDTPKKHRWTDKKHWKKPSTSKAPSKKKTDSTETKLLSEGDHLIGPAEDLLGSPEHLISPDDAPTK